MTDEEDLLASPKGGSSIQDRIMAFEMLDQMPTATQAQKTVRLSLVGFNRQEIAAMLGISAAQVSQNLYAEKNKGKKPAKKVEPKAS